MNQISFPLQEHQNYEMWLGMMGHACATALWMAKQKALELEASLGYITTCFYLKLLKMQIFCNYRSKPNSSLRVEDGSWIALGTWKI